MKVHLSISYVDNGLVKCIHFQQFRVQRRAKNIWSLIFYYIFHIKPYFFKTLILSQFFFDFYGIFTI